MSVEELVKELNEVDDHLTTMAADKLEELAAENEQQFQMLANQAQTIKVLQAALALITGGNDAE